MRNDVPRLQGDRIALEPLVLADSHAIQRLFPHWEIVRYLSHGMQWPYPADGARRLLQEVTFPSVAQGIEWAWSIRLNGKQGPLIGVISVADRPNDNRGFWLGLDWHGQGLMTEACKLATDYWFDVLGFPVMRVSKAMANMPSRRLSEREGMRLIQVGPRDFVSGRMPAGIWETTAAQWRSRVSASPSQRNPYPLASTE